MHKFSIVCDYIHNALINIEAPTPPPHPTPLSSCVNLVSEKILVLLS